MRLTDTPNKIKSYVARVAGAPDLSKDVFMALLILLVGGGAFMLGRLSAAETARKNTLSVTGASALHALSVQSGSMSKISPANVVLSASTTPAGMYVGSKSGKTYHLPWCSGAKRIREGNKVWFQSKEEAEGMGYRAAANCKGI